MLISPTSLQLTCFWVWLYIQTISQNVIQNSNKDSLLPELNTTLRDFKAKSKPSIQNTIATANTAARTGSIHNFLSGKITLKPERKYARISSSSTYNCICIHSYHLQYTTKYNSNKLQYRDTVVYISQIREPATHIVLRNTNDTGILLHPNSTVYIQWHEYN